MQSSPQNSKPTKRKRKEKRNGKQRKTRSTVAGSTRLHAYQANL